MQTHNIMGIRSKVIMNRYINDVIVMEEISEEDENNIDKIMTKDNGYFSNKENYMIPTRDIFLYGEIDLNKKSDINLIENTDLIIEDINNACNIPSNFDYDKGIIYSDNENIFRCHNTWNKLDWFKYNYVLLGKPKRIIMYKIHKNYVPDNLRTGAYYNINAIRNNN